MDFAEVSRDIPSLLLEVLESPPDELSDANRDRLHVVRGAILELFGSTHVDDGSSTADSLLDAVPGIQVSLMQPTLSSEACHAAPEEQTWLALDGLHAEHVLVSTTTINEGNSSLRATAVLRGRVLLAVLDPELRESIPALLGDRFDIDIVGDVETGFALIGEHRPDLLLLGERFLRLNNFELLRTLGESPALRDLPVIRLSTNQSDNARLSGLQLGAGGYVVKPPSAGALAERASTIVENRRTSEKTHESERRLVSHLSALAAASLEFQRVEPLPELLDLVTRTAASLISAHQSLTFVVSSPDWGQSTRATWLSDKYDAYRDFEAPSTGEGIYAMVCETNLPVRFTQAELEEHPRFHDFGEYASNHPPLRGWLAAPLITQDGRNFGLIQLSDKLEGDFTVEDESVLVQLAQIAASAIETSDLLDHLQHNASILAAIAATKEEMLGLVSHELRTPLTTLRGNASALRRYGKRIDSQEREAALTDIEHDAEHLAEIVDNMLALARLDAAMKPELEPSLLRRTLEPVIADFGRYTGRAVELKLPKELAPVLANEEYLHQVLINLLTNAVKYGGDAGPIEVELVCEDGNAVVTVTDRGPGMTPETIAQLWEPFFRAKDQAGKPGIGLGLPVCKRLIEAQGGRIWAKSRLGDGSVFGFELPLADF